MTADLLARLRGRARYLRDLGRVKSPEMMDEAALEIEHQAETIARMTEENERLSKAVCGGVMRDLLSDDEVETLADFIKMLREQPK